jgi:DNA-binding CsgD family transcriptional regulator/tetratricopeptide (TPR) repeat protein
VYGEAGIGKTVLLEHAHERAALSGFRVQTVTGVASESQFALGALYQLCRPLLGDLDALPEPQQIALRVAFGQQAGAAPDRFVIGLAVLNLLSELADKQPLLCIVDDAQWLDEASAQVLAFVARRVGGVRLALLFSLRDPSDDGDLRSFAGLPELRLHGLAESDARALLAAAVPTPLDDGVGDRIIDEARGNPLALLELPRSAPTLGLASGLGLPEDVSVPRRIEERFRQRSRGLPAETQLLLLLAAAESSGDAATLWRAAATLGIEPGAAASAEEAGLVEIDTSVRFRHPLVRSAVYQAATESDRRRVHGALADSDATLDPDQRAWHRARAVLGTDEDTAAELERCADRAHARSGLAAAAAFLHQSFQLTPDPARRAGRALAAAQAEEAAGAPGTALELLEVAEAGPLDDVQRARLQLLRARAVFQLRRGSEVLGMLLGAAEALAPLDPVLSRQTYLQALQAAVTTGGDGVRTAARAALGAPAPPGPPTPADLFLDGLATTYTQGYEAGVPALRRALEACRDDERDGYSDRWLGLASRLGAILFEDDLVATLAERHVRLARRTGALADLPAALLMRSQTLVLAGELARAAELAAEGTAIAHAIGAVPLPQADLILAGWRGDDAGAALVDATLARTAVEHLDATAVSLAHYARAVLHNARGDYGAALTAAARARQTDELPYSNVALPEIAEAASRAGEPARALAAVEELEMRARATDGPWGLGLAARSRALITAGPGAEKHYLEALDLLERHHMVSYGARTHLVYGEWLRREGRRHEAREQLRTAHRLLTGMGADAFAERAAKELRATGEHPRKRTAHATDALTTHELQIARLVSTGATTREVAQQLFLSPRTIEAHLRTIFRKLGITSRRQLKDLQLTDLQPTTARGR